MKSSHIHFGDIVSFLVEDLGYLAIPSQREPIPEKNDHVSMIRVFSSENVTNGKSDDFETR